ncbi:hypothetical protein COOONC_11963 [Cooperia oncophora]
MALRTVAYYQVSQEMKDPRTQHIGRLLQRKDWDAWDPTLVSESVFATANIFSSLKLVHIFTVNPYLGPLKISLDKFGLQTDSVEMTTCTGRSGSDLSPAAKLAPSATIAPPPSRGRRLCY